MNRQILIVENKVYAKTLRRLLLFSALAVFFFFALAPQTRLAAPFFQRIPLFKVSRVVVRPDWPLTEEQIRAWLPNLEGTSLLSVSPKEIAIALKGKPWVKEVAVKKEYPDRLRVDIETQRPVAMTLIDGKPHFLDVTGQVIDRVSHPVLRALDLPFLTQENDNATWNREEFLTVLSSIKERLGSSFVVSQVALGTYPYFKIFLSNPQIEIVMTLETWEEQWPILERLLANQSPLTGQLLRINLLFPKKAVVSRLNSK